MFNKPISQLNEEDIQTLVNNKERESLVLEFKQEISGTDKEKKEISKDVSAMANTQGGYLIIGVKETNSQAEAIIGTPIVIGSQPVEAWIENVIISNVRPKIFITPKIVALKSMPDRVVLVIYIPQSHRRPHMVIAEGKHAYYTRHNYQATYADEHEVRSMFFESKDMEEEIQKFLSSRNLVDHQSSTFGDNYLSLNLSKSIRQFHKFHEEFISSPFIVFAACPRYLEERVDIASSDFRDWLNTNDKIDLFGRNIDFLDYEKVVSADSIRSVKEIERGEGRATYRYVEIFRNGYLEAGISPELIWPHQDITLLQIGYFTAAFWIFMKFAKKFYEQIKYFDEVKITVALVDMENVMLHGFGRKNKGMKWLNPYEAFYVSDRLPVCKQKNVKIERNIIASEFNEESIEALAGDIAKRVANAFGENIAKCFDEDGNFDTDTISSFRR